jgi:HTH-type transcriptional regulator/antitoxin HigA
MTIQTLEKEFKTGPHPVASPEARWLYTHLPPLPIVNDKDHAVYKKVVELLMGEEKTGGDYRAYLDAVIHFLDEYERIRFPTQTTPEDVLRFLMDQHDLTQSDLAGDLGGQSVVSEILNGKRKLTRDHIEKLSRRFSIPAVSFFPSAKAA